MRKGTNNQSACGTVWKKVVFYKIKAAAGNKSRQKRSKWQNEKRALEAR